MQLTQSNVTASVNGASINIQPTTLSHSIDNHSNRQIGFFQVHINDRSSVTDHYSKIDRKTGQSPPLLNNQLILTISENQ